MNRQFEKTELAKHQAKALEENLKTAIEANQTFFFRTKTPGEIPDVLMAEKGLAKTYNYAVFPAIFKQDGKLEHCNVYVNLRQTG